MMNMDTAITVIEAFTSLLFLVGVMVLGIQGVAICHAIVPCTMRWCPVALMGL